MKLSINNRKTLVASVLFIFLSSAIMLSGGCCVRDSGDVSYSAGAVYSLGEDNDGQVIFPGDKGELYQPKAKFTDAYIFSQKNKSVAGSLETTEKRNDFSSGASRNINERFNQYDIPGDKFISRRGFASMTEQTTLEEAINLISNSTQPPVNIVVNWRDLSQNADIDKNTLIGMKGMKGIKVRKALELVLMSVAGNDQTLGYTVEDNVVTVATIDTLGKRKMTTKVYDVTDILSAPGDFYTVPELLNSTVSY